MTHLIDLKNGDKVRILKGYGRFAKGAVLEAGENLSIMLAEQLIRDNEAELVPQRRGGCTAPENKAIQARS